MNYKAMPKHVLSIMALLCLFCFSTPIQAQDEPMMQMQRKEVQRLMTTTELGMLEAEYINGKLTELKIDGKDISKEEYSKYEKMLPSITMPQDHGNPNIQKRELIIEEDFPNPMDMLGNIDEMDLDSAYKMLFRSFDKNGMNSIQDIFDMNDMPLDSMMQFGLQFFDSEGGQLNFGGSGMDLNSIFKEFFDGMQEYNGQDLEPQNQEDFNIQKLLEEQQKRLQEQEKKKKIKQI